MPSTRGRNVWALRDPPSRPDDRKRVRALVRELAGEFVSRGARSVVLGGSWARGDAHRASDIDLWVLGPQRPRHEALWRAPYLVSVTRTTESRERTRLRTPPEVGGSVPGWRVAVPIHDPEGIARRLKGQARRFRWAQIARRCDRWIADQMVGWAEEAIKLVRALATGQNATAAVQRYLLAEHLGFVEAIHRRTFWDSENEFWERIGRQVGGPWALAQRRALGVPRSGHEAGCRAALELYAATAADVWSRLGPDQRSIVANACQVAAVPLRPRGRAVS
jgi:hypothetical protein